MKEYYIKDEFHRNLRMHFTRSTFLIGKHDVVKNEEIIIRSKSTGDEVIVKVLRSDTRDMPVFTDAEAESIAGKDALFLMHLICRWYSIEQLDCGITYIEHSRPEVADSVKPKRYSKPVQNESGTQHPSP